MLLERDKIRKEPFGREMTFFFVKIKKLRTLSKRPDNKLWNNWTPPVLLLCLSQGVVKSYALSPVSFASSLISQFSIAKIQEGGYQRPKARIDSVAQTEKQINVLCKGINIRICNCTNP